MSGILSSITLSGVEMSLELPEHIFAQHGAQRDRIAQRKNDAAIFFDAGGSRGEKRRAAPGDAGDAHLFSVSAEAGERAANGADDVSAAWTVPPRSVSHRHAVSFWLFAEARRVNLSEALLFPWWNRLSFSKFCPGCKVRWRASPRAMGRIYCAARLRVHGQRAARPLESFGALREADGAGIYAGR